MLFTASLRPDEERLETGKRLMRDSLRTSGNDPMAYFDEAVTRLCHNGGERVWKNPLLKPSKESDVSTSCLLFACLLACLSVCLLVCLFCFLSSCLFCFVSSCLFPRCFNSLARALFSRRGHSSNSRLTCCGCTHQRIDQSTNRRSTLSTPTPPSSPM